PRGVGKRRPKPPLPGNLEKIRSVRVLRYLAAAFSVWAPCFLKVRVGENSPSLWPTMFSVTKTELKILPLCTRKVWPTKSGVMSERRDQVWIGFFTGAV